MTDQPSRFERMQQRYRSCDIPWDHELPPPEVMAVAERLPAGRILDLGCGAARASIYLAVRGWQADAVDFVPEAIAMAQERVKAAGLAGRVALHVGSVTDMHFLEEGYNLAIDVGCFHGLQPEEQQLYARELARLMRPGSICLLYAHCGHNAQESGPTGIARGLVESLFGPDFEIAHVEYGRTIMRDLECDSAWYELVRKEGSGSGFRDQEAKIGVRGR